MRNLHIIHRVIRPYGHDVGQHFRRTLRRKEIGRHKRALRSKDRDVNHIITPLKFLRSENAVRTHPAG